jgi:AmmeMemoRadiSam system protein A
MYSGYRTVRIGLSGLSPLLHYRFGLCIAKAADRLGRRVVLIASGDLSHKLTPEGPYGFTPEGPEFDKQITDMFAAGDFLSILRFPSDLADAAAECGLRSFQIMAGALDRKAVTHDLLSYEGPFGVGYGVAFFEVIGEDHTRNFGDQYDKEESELLATRKTQEDDYVRLAQMSLETYIKTGKRASLPDWLPTEMLHTRAGAFVSLKKHGQLRGCIGTISATKNSVAEEILQNAISAAISDPRFEPISEDELNELVYSVDVLGDAEVINSPDLLDVKRYGVIVQSGRRRGLLLPNLEGVNSVAEQIAISKQKAGICTDEPVDLFRFEVVRHQ